MFWVVQLVNIDYCASWNSEKHIIIILYHIHFFFLHKILLITIYLLNTKMFLIGMIYVFIHIMHRHHYIWRLSVWYYLIACLMLQWQFYRFFHLAGIKPKQRSNICTDWYTDLISFCKRVLIDNLNRTHTANVLNIVTVS